MDTIMKVSFGFAALATAGTIAFAPASADKGNGARVALAMLATTVVASPETSQDMVWDMTYGSERPGVGEESATADEGAIVDYTFG